VLEEGKKVPKGLEGIIIDSNSITDNPDGKRIKLDELWKKGLVIFYFYPKDSTPGCTIEARAFQEESKIFKKLNAQVVGCSRDTIKSHCRFIEKQSLEFPLVSDDTGKITEAFGVWQEKKLYGRIYMGIARSTFIIKNGVVLKSYPEVKVKVHPEEVINFIKELK